MPNEKELDNSKNPWLDAWKDPCGGLKVFSSHLALCDPNGIGEHMLVIADLTGVLKVYRNTDVHTSFQLLGVPCGIEFVFPDPSRIPMLAIPSGSFIYFYRNLRPYYKFEVPPDEYSEDEKEIWSGDWHPKVLENLLEIAEKIDISGRSKKLLSINNIDEQKELFESLKPIPFQKQSYVTCLTSIPHDSLDTNSKSSLVFGTETKHIYIMELQGNATKIDIKIPDVPSIVCVTGCLNVEYRIFVANRSNSVHVIKDGQLLQTTISLPSHICFLDVHLSTLFVACLDHRVYLRHFRGQCHGVLEQPSAITAMNVYNHPNTQSKQVLLVGLKSSELRMYVNKILVHSMHISGGISGMTCGIYGRAESALIIVTNEGNLNIKLLKRNYAFGEKISTEFVPSEQETPIELPQISKLYLEQTEREKQKALSMHRTFQGDILSLRIQVHKTYAKILREGLGPISHHGKFKLNVEVIGLGPLFKLRFEVRNLGSHPSFNMFLVLCVDNRYYECVGNSMISIPVMVPELCYFYMLPIRNIHPDGCAQRIKVHLIDVLHTEPILSAIVGMPVVAELEP